MSRFTFVNEEEVTEAKKNSQPENSHKMEKSAFNNFCAWAKARNAEKNCDIPTSVEALKYTYLIY